MLKFSTCFSTCFQHSFQHALQISIHTGIFNMLFQHSKVFCSMHIMQELHTNRPNFQHSFQYALQISIHTGIFNMLFQHSKVFHAHYAGVAYKQAQFSLHFNMHYRFQHVLKFSTLQISTCITDFNTC